MFASCKDGYNSAMERMVQNCKRIAKLVFEEHYRSGKRTFNRLKRIGEKVVLAINLFSRQKEAWHNLCY
jgi:hypothetical protein